MRLAIRRLAFSCLATCLAIPSVGQHSAPASNRQSPPKSVSDREKDDLRGPVKTCVTQRTDLAYGSNPEHTRTTTTEYSPDGRVLSEQPCCTHRYYEHHVNSKGGRRTEITNGPATLEFRFDAEGRRTETVVRRRAYRTTTTYDDQDRILSSEGRKADGTLVDHIVATYDAHGNLIEKKSAIDDPASVFPPARWAKLTPEQKSAASAQIAAQSTCITSYAYDAQNRVIGSHDECVGGIDDRTNSYNKYGDLIESIESRVTSNLPNGTTTTGVNRWSYQYDSQGNWTDSMAKVQEAGGSFTAYARTHRILTYY
jgi:hypothetical protein